MQDYVIFYFWWLVLVVILYKTSDLLPAQAVGSEPARVLFRTGTRPLWDAIAPTHSTTATAATSPLPRRRSSKWGQSPSLSPTRWFHAGDHWLTFLSRCLRSKLVNDPLCLLDFQQVQNQHFQNHTALQQVQSKDMPPRFSTKGQLNADEVTRTSFCWLAGGGQKHSCSPRLH